MSNTFVYSAIRGSSGYSGLTGNTGVQGAQGAKGSTGAQGAAGAQGLTGAQGASGYSGFSGLKGSTGAQGAQGTAGTNGIQGAQGASGYSGFSGAFAGTGVSGYGAMFTGTNSLSANSFFFSGGNVGIGTASPAYRLQIGALGDTKNSRIYIPETYGPSGVYLGPVTSNSGARLELATHYNATLATSWSIAHDTDTTGAGNLTFNVSNPLSAYPFTYSEKMRIDSSGNVGIGVTPSAWGVYDAGTIQKSYGAFWASYNNQSAFGLNCYFNGSNWIYSNSNNASIYTQTGGQHIWNAATTGTAGNPIYFIETMRLDASGNLGIGTTSPAGALDVSGSGNIYISNKTSAPTNSQSLPGTLNFTGYGHNTSVGSVSIAGQIGLSAVYGALNGGSTEPAITFSLKGTGSGTYNTTAGPTTLTERMRLDNYGRLGIGTSSPAYTLDLSGSARITTSLGVGTTPSGTTGEIRATGNITAYYSDDRLKTKLGVIENALDKICSLEGFYYEANETAQALGYEPVREVGISAQATQKVLPEIVAPAPIDEKYLTVRYERLAPLLIEAIKELREENKILREEIKTLK